MAKNLMPEVAKLLGVEMGEAFYINDHLGRRVCAYSDNNLFKIGESALLHLNNTDGCFESTDRDHIIFVKLLAGLLTIEKLPWEPKQGEEYWTIIFRGDGKPFVHWCIWGNDSCDFSRKALNMIYRTRGEAEAHLVEDYERLTGRELEG